MGTSAVGLLNASSQGRRNEPFNLGKTPKHGQEVAHSNALMAGLSKFTRPTKRFSTKPVTSAASAADIKLRVPARAESDPPRSRSDISTISLDKALANQAFAKSKEAKLASASAPPPSINTTSQRRLSSNALSRTNAFTRFRWREGPGYAKSSHARPPRKKSAHDWALKPQTMRKDRGGRFHFVNGRKSPLG